MPKAVIVLEEASMGRPDSLTRAKSPGMEGSQGQTLMDFGPHSHLTYVQVLHQRRKYVQENFGWYRHVQRQQQDITLPYAQQVLEFVPTSTPSSLKHDVAAQAFAEWLQTPEAGHLYEQSERERFDKGYDKNLRNVHDVCCCTIM